MVIRLGLKLDKLIVQIFKQLKLEKCFYQFKVDGNNIQLSYLVIIGIKESNVVMLIIKFVGFYVNERNGKLNLWENQLIKFYMINIYRCLW